MKNLFDDKEIMTKQDMVEGVPLTINPQLEDKLNSLPLQNTYQNEAEVNKDEGAYQIDTKRAAPTFSETFKHSMPFISSLSDAPDLNPLNDNTPDGWNAASDENNFIGVPQKYQGHIAKATSPNDAFFKRKAALDLAQQDEDFENGSLLAKFSGGFVDSLPFAIIPMGGAAKYMTVSKSVIEGMMAAAPGLATSSLLYNASVQSSKIGGSIEETVVDTYIDTMAGLAFVGGIHGLGRSVDSLKLFDARKLMKLNYDGIVPEIKVDKDGKVLGYVATPVSGENVSAAKVDEAQKFLDSSFARNGLFSVPYIGEFVGKGIAKVNPIFRGLTSRFPTIRGFTDRISSHSLITEGVEAGREKPEDFETLFGIVQAENKQYYGTMESLLDKRNDINNKSNLVNLAERTAKKWTKDGYIDAETFGKEIKQVIFSGNSSEHAAVNEAAMITRQYLDDTWNLLRETYKLPENWMPPPTSDGYFPRVYDLVNMETNPQEWQNMWVSWWKTADKEITTVMKPIRDFEAQVKIVEANNLSLRQSGKATDEQLKSSAKELAAHKRKLRKMREDLADKIKSDKRMFLHGDDHAALSGKESRDLKKLMKPMRIAKKAMKAQKTVFDKLKQDRFYLENKLKSAGDKNKVAKLQKELKALDANIAAEKANYEALKDKYDIESDKLQEKAHDGLINPRFYDRIPDSQLVKFKKPSNLMKLRPLFESEFHMQQQADALRSTILNQTPEDTLQQILGQHIGSASENHTLKRTQMIPDEELQANNFLSNNLPLVVANYRNALQRKIIMKQIFSDVTIDGGIAPIAERLTVELKAQEKLILNDKSLKEADRKKELKKLHNDFNDAKEFLQKSFNRMMGRNSGNKKMREFTRFMRLWTVATRLGSVPLTMVTDLSANVYKHGFWPTLRDGLLPALENIAHVLKKPEGKAYIENAAHAHLGLSTTLAAYNDRDWAGIAMQQVPMTGKLNNFMEKAAHVSGNISFTNQFENFLQRVTANIVQSKIMKYMLDYEAGKLKPKDLDKLLKYGLNPEDWSKRFIENWKARGSDGNGFGGYQSRYFEWADAEASNKMARTIFKATNDTIIRKGMMDAPFFFDDPLLGTISFLHGWSAAALTRYTLPLMQRPDAEHLLGLMSMLMAGSLVAPMRKISRGESPIDDETNMFWDAAQDSGILSPITSVIENANILSHGRILRGIVNDRYKQRSELSAALGPIFGMGQDITKIIGMFVDGRLNETDVKKMARLVPTMQPWYLRGLQNHMIESLGLPKNKTEALNDSGNAYR